ncbi:MAG TPA: sigma 54-interacting transcriptional regulator [Myxococcota bacterium]|nr:sigma 54-interacting transcriptional regulator [Myxococcota bacterium]HRY95568.1 sigma 54-interacting transcriptional regulator [Myxococcota bacterium]HSA22322.1 sigma 54-interacting transcriptional regulator [Myxococcota bacterium]
MAERDDKASLLQTTTLSAEDRAKLRAARGLPAVAPGSTSLLVYSRDGVRLVTLQEGQSLVIGREPPADITVRDSSLSRQHASLELSSGVLWVEDLQSTNGTWVNGERVERSKVEPGAELAFGAVVALVPSLRSAEASAAGLEGHDRFQRVLEVEALRARTFGRKLACLMLRAEGHVGRWFERIQPRLRRFDACGLYSQDTLEVLLPEEDAAGARGLVATLARDVPGLRCGLGLMPDHACSAEGLLALTHDALRRTSPAQPLQLAVEEACGESPEAACAPGCLVIRSPATVEVYRVVERLARSSIPVLIFGETGTGKEMVARAIHQQSKRSAKPIRCVNCGGIPAQLVESTLFGHEKGAFTGAERQAAGVFESADGGSVLLDEIGELPPAAQAALLRVLETKRFTRVGSTKELEVDVRILAATHKDLEAMAKAGTFREDLLYRLNAMTLRLPPLRERVEEIEPLALYFLTQACQADGRKVAGIAPEALDLLRQHDWPGNVRELRNAIERAVVITRGPRLEVEDLPERVREHGRLAPQPAAEAAPGGAPSEINLKSEMNRLEAELIRKALVRSHWDRNLAASSLGLPLRTLSHKMQVLGIRRDD